MLRLINWISFSTLRREKEAAESDAIDQSIIMSAFEERAPLLSSSSEQHEKILLSPRKKSSTSVKKKNNNVSSASSWTTKSVMIGTTALVFGAAVMSTQQQRSTFTIGGGEDVEGNLGATTTTGEMSSSTVSDMITLTLGCTSKATLGLLPFPNGGFVGKVGAKLSLKSKDHNFGFQHAVAMTEVGCGTYVVSHKLEEGEQFGFYL